MRNAKRVTLSHYDIVMSYQSQEMVLEYLQKEHGFDLKKTIIAFNDIHNKETIFEQEMETNENDPKTSNFDRIQKRGETF